MRESQQQVKSMRAWVTLLVTVTLATTSSGKKSGNGEYGGIPPEEYGESFDPTEESSMSSESGERSFLISKGQEKLLKDFPGARAKVRDGNQGKIQSESDFVLSEEEDDERKNKKEKKSRESNDRRRKKEKPNMWKNYAKGKYGIEESVDLSILKPTTRKVMVKQTKDAITTPKGKSKVREVKKSAKDNKRAPKKIQENKIKENKVKSKPVKNKSKSHSDIEEEMELNISSEPEANHKKGKVNLKRKNKHEEFKKPKKKSESHRETEEEMELNMSSELEAKDKQGKSRVHHKNKFKDTKTPKEKFESHSETEEEIELNMSSELEAKDKQRKLNVKHKKKSESHSEITNEMELEKQNKKRYKIVEHEGERKLKETEEQSKKKSESDEMEFNLFSNYIRNERKKNPIPQVLSSNEKSLTKKTKIKGESLKEHDNDHLEGQTYETNVDLTKEKHTSADKSEEYESKHIQQMSHGDEKETKVSDNRKKSPVKTLKAKEKKTKVQNIESDEEYEFDDDLDGHTYETSSNHKAKDRHISMERSEEYNDNEDKADSRSNNSGVKSKHTDHEESQSYVRSHRESDSKKRQVKSKKKGKQSKSEDSKIHVTSEEVIVKKDKETKDTSKKPKKSGKGKRIKYTTTPYVKIETTTERKHRVTQDPLEMSTEELLQHEQMVNRRTTETTIMTTDLFQPTTLKPLGTEHWICPSDVKSQSIDIHWSNYDSHGQRKEMKPIDPKFRNKMKRFSTKELKGRLKQVARRAQRKGAASFDASGALKRVRFNEVFKIKPIDDEDIFRNVTYQPTVSREFEVRMLEKNYRQKYGRRQATEEQQKEFEYMLKFMGNNSKALSEETCKRIQEDEFKKLVACCDTQEISSLMADFRDSSPHKIKYLKSKGRLPLTTSEEIEAMEKAENPEEQKRARYKAQHKNKGRLKEKDLQNVEMFKGEHKDLDKEYIANSREMNEPIVSGLEEVEEETQNTQGLTYFPGGRFINTEELDEMKKENEYYERMRKIGGRITRMYNPKNTLSSSEWAALEATTMKPPRWSKPTPRPKVTVRGRRRRSVSQSQESQGHSKQSQGHSIECQGQSKSTQGRKGKTSKQRGPPKDTVSAKKITVDTTKTDDGNSKKTKEQLKSDVESIGRNRNIVGTKKKISENSGESKVQQESITEATTNGKLKESTENLESTAKKTTLDGTKTFGFVASRGDDEWSAISSKNSEFFLDNRKQLRKRKSTDKRFNMVANIIKRHARLKYNRSDWYARTLTRWQETQPTVKLPLTEPHDSRRKRMTFTTKIYVVTPDWSYLMDSKNEKKLDAFEKSYEDTIKHIKLFERRCKGFTSDEYFGSASPRPRTNEPRASQVDSLSIEPDYMTDSDIMRHIEEKRDKDKEDRADLFTDTEEEDARATWYKMKLHQFFYKYNITKEEWQRMMNQENRKPFNATHQKYTNAKREYFVMPEDTWNELASRNITSEEFKSFNKKNRKLIRFCRGQRLNYSARKRQRPRRKLNATKERLQDRYGAYMEDILKDRPSEETPSYIQERNKRLRSKKNLTDEEEIYLALGGPLPYDPNFWPASFLRSHEVFQEMKKHYDDEEEFQQKDTRERRRIINEKIIKNNKKDLEAYEKNKNLIEQGKMKTIPDDIWHGYTGIRKKIWEYYLKESAEKRKAKEARKAPQQFQEFNEKKIEIDLDKVLNETKTITQPKLKKTSNVLKITTEKYPPRFDDRYARGKVDERSREKKKIRRFDDRYAPRKMDDRSREKKTLRRFDDRYAPRKMDDRSREKKIFKNKKKPIVGNRITPKNEISRRERAKERDKNKYGSEYSKIAREKYRRKSQASYSSRSREARGRDNRRRYDSRERRPRNRYDENNRRAKYASYEKRKYDDSRDRKKYVDSRDKKRSSSSEKKPKQRKINKGRPERFKKKKPDKKKKKKRGKREVFGTRGTTVDPIFHESRSEYQRKMVVDEAWLVRRRAYLAEKYARLSREAKERVLRKQGKLKEGETISTKKPTTPYHIRKDPINARELELGLLLRGFTRRPGYEQEMGETPSVDEAQYEKAELQYVKRKKSPKGRESSDSDESRTAPPITVDPGDYLYADKYAKAEDEFIAEQKRKNMSSEHYSYYSNVDKSYVTDHNPDYGSQERMAKLEENMIIDYKNKEVQFKNSPSMKYGKEDPTLTIPTWPTKWKNRGVRPQDRKLCYFNPSTTSQYRQVLYIYHKYKQLKEAHDRKENIDDIPSLDSDY